MRMADRANHYEAAFEAFLRHFRVPYIAVDEAKRSLCEADQSIKSLDFIVTAGGVNWLVDVKGRRFPSGPRGSDYWRNWAFEEDLVSLDRWERLFGPGFAGLFVFAYHLVKDRSPLPAEQVFEYQRRLYAFVGIELAVYRQKAVEISPSWQTVAMPRSEFRRMVRPVWELLGIASNARQMNATGVLPNRPHAQEISSSPAHKLGSEGNGNTGESTDKDC
ncbi:MAG: hypothetical protein D6741_18950 [Planctomycetota bacterium]|nr:MAG: hypothetical protein D6741_18950 [Planctomycetota bacterium]